MEDLSRPEGDVHLLMSQLELMPVDPVERVAGLGVFESMFGSGVILSGMIRH